MVPLITEHLWVWIVAAGFLFFIGTILFSQTGNLKSFSLFLIGAVLVLGLGVVMVYFVKTDRKEIKKTIFDLAAAVERNDIDAVLAGIDGSAGKTIAKATHHLGLAKIEKAAVSQFSIRGINQFTSPPTAQVSFNGAVRGTVSASMLSSPFAVIVRFESVELVKNDDGVWRVTDQCIFKYPGYHGN